MPQDIPLEASDVLAFTPASLASIEGAPVFTLRTATHREKRFRTRMIREEGIEYHPVDAIREEVLVGLRNLWTEEDYATNSNVLTDYWQQSDDYEQQRADRDREIAEATAASEGKEDAEIPPPLESPIDPKIERACQDLVRKVSREWRPVGQMLADNREVQDIGLQLYALVIVKDWRGLDVKRQLDRGYLTMDCVDALKEALAKFEAANLPEGGTAGSAWNEVLLACSACFNLSEEEAKNFVSPSPSSESPQPSTETSTSEQAGTSQASASSTETPVISSETSTGNSSVSTASATVE